MTQLPLLAGFEPMQARCERLARDMAQATRARAADAGIDQALLDEVLEWHYAAGYQQGQDDARTGSARDELWRQGYQQGRRDAEAGIDNGG